MFIVTAVTESSDFDHRTAGHYGVSKDIVQACADVGAESGGGTTCLEIYSTSSG
jgi:hypothetical protein